MSRSFVVLVALLFSACGAGGLFAKEDRASRRDIELCALHFEYVRDLGADLGSPILRRLYDEAEDEELRRLGAKGGELLFEGLESISRESESSSGSGVPAEVGAIYDLHNAIGRRCQVLSPSYQEKMDKYCRESDTCTRK